MKIFILALTVLLSSNVDAKIIHKHSATAAYNTPSYLIADETGTIIKEQDIDLVRPIASISKLLIAIITSEQDPSEKLDIPKFRSVQSSIPHGENKLSRIQLLTFALVKSDNFAAQILCSNKPDCINAANNKARELGMTNTHIVEPTGLSIENVSTASDLLKLMMYASTNDTITSITKLPYAVIPTEHHLLTIHNTNPLTSTLNVVISKTGFTNPAGGCLVLAVNSPAGKKFLVLLGSKNTHTRITEMSKLYTDSQAPID